MTGLELLEWLAAIPFNELARATIKLEITETKPLITAKYDKTESVITLVWK